jgi:hypothetical protein
MKRIAICTHAAPLIAAAFFAAPAVAHDYPTAERVLYVEDCMRQYPGAHYEMVSKCSCVLDTIAGQVPYDDFVVMTTATKANTIGGERGNVIRDAEPLQQQIRRFRELQAAARKSCFIQPDASKQ